MRTRLTAVGEEEVADTVVAGTSQQTTSTVQQQSAALAGLFLALKALSQRSIVALAGLVDFCLIASAFALWWQIIASPTWVQIASSTIYSVFIGCLVLMRRK
jgi:hypothetical protein